MRDNTVVQCAFHVYSKSTQVLNKFSSISNSHLNKVIIGYLNINFLRKKVWSTNWNNQKFRWCTIDIGVFMTVFWKINSILLDHHAPFRIDQNGNDGALFLYVQKDKSSNFLCCNFTTAVSYLKFLKHFSVQGN